MDIVLMLCLFFIIAHESNDRNFKTHVLHGALLRSTTMFHAHHMTIPQLIFGYFFLSQVQLIMSDLLDGV